MQGAYRNKQRVWYANNLGKEVIVDDQGRSTGDYRIKYDNPKEIWLNISQTSGLTNNNITGKVTRERMGEMLDYNYTLNPLPDDWEGNEQTVFWIDTPPVLNTDGSTDTPPDYIMFRMSKALNWYGCQVARIEIQH